MRQPWSALYCYVRGANCHFLFIAQRLRAQTEGYLRTGTKLSFYIPHSLHHNGMKPVPCSAGWTAELPFRRRVRRYKLPGRGSTEGGRGPGHVASVVASSWPALAGGIEKLFHQGPARCRRPWSLRDRSCQRVHTDVTSQYRIVAIFTVVDSQALYQRILLVFMCFCNYLRTKFHIYSFSGSEIVQSTPLLECF